MKILVRRRRSVVTKDQVERLFLYMEVLDLHENGAVDRGLWRGKI